MHTARACGGYKNMTEFSGDQFFDYGNAPEVLIESKAVPAWELLESGLVRLFVCKFVQGKLVLDHTDLMTPATMAAIGRRFLEIADAAQVARAAKSPTPMDVLNLH